MSQSNLTRTGISRPPERISTPAVPPCLLLAHTKKDFFIFFWPSVNFLEHQFLGEAPPSVCLRCWNFFLHRTIYSGLRLHSQGTPLQANGPGTCFTLLCAPVCTSTSTPTVHNCPEVCTHAVHNSADICTSWCSTHAVHNLC